MKKLYVNLKRFDIPVEFGGVNALEPVEGWGAAIVGECAAGLARYAPQTASFTFFLPEAHLLSALAAQPAGSRIMLGCQGVWREDVAPGGNFGAFTTNRPAAAAKALGCEAVLIGHCEERRALLATMAEAGATGVPAMKAVNRILNSEVKCALARGLQVLYCIGETADEQEEWMDILHVQMGLGLAGISEAQLQNVTLAYEPVWAIGPGKTPPGREYIEKIAAWVKKNAKGMPLVYGGGLKADNAAMLASIDEIDGGLIALTRFTGSIGFYPEEFLEIVRLYLGQ